MTIMFLEQTPLQQVSKTIKNNIVRIFAFFSGGHLNMKHAVKSPQCKKCNEECNIPVTLPFGSY